MAWYNPIDDAKWLASKASAGYHKVTGTDYGTRAPGAAAEYNPGSRIAAVRDGRTTGGATPVVAPRLSDQTGMADPWHIDDKTRKDLLSQQAGQSGQFADASQHGYESYQPRTQESLNYLQAIARGQNSVSAEQLRQSMQQGQAAQFAMAAGASPRNSAMASRTAAIGSGRLATGLAGQQAMAGLQERQQGQTAYAALLQGLRGQDLSAALSSRQNAMTGYGAGASGAPSPDWWQKNGPAIQAGLTAIAASDRRGKTDIKRADDAANKAADVPAYTYRYKDPRNGIGPRLGVMAQDLERAGLGHAVIDTPGGKLVHGAQLATANTAMIGALARRLGKLESKAR